VEMRGRRQLLVKLDDGTGELQLRFLNFYGSQQKAWAPGVRLRVRGELRVGFFGREMVHPTVRTVSDATPLATSLTPIYPAGAGLPQSYLRKAVEAGLRRAPLDEVLPSAVAAMLPAHWPSLRQALQQLHSHAVLLHGPEGVGQFEFSLALSRAWLCEQPADGGDGAGGMSVVKPACGQCVSCKLMNAGSHPDFHLVLPEALQASLGLGGSEGGADDGADGAGDGGSEKSGEKGSKSRKPSQEIKVDAIRAVVQFSQSTASRGRAKVVMVHPVERMNMVAANTLLKTLEEPPGRVRFVLSGSALEQLLPTVRSRCQACISARRKAGSAVSESR